MTDFFDPKDNNQNMDDNQQVVEKIKIGEEEFTPEEAQEYIKLGKLGREMEEKWNTKIDRIYPEFSKSQNELKELREAEATRNATPPAPVTNPEDALDEETIQRARKEARKIGIVTEDAFDEFLGNKFRDYFVRARFEEKLIDRMDGLARDLNGEDGRPRFDQKEVVEFMRNNGVSDPEVAYKIMHEKELDAWKAQQLTAAKREGLYTENTSTAGGKQPAAVKPTADNLSQLVAEALERG